MAHYQTTYAKAPAKGLPGQVANEELCNKISRTVENAEGIEFGQPAFRGAGDHGVAASGSVFIGLAVLNPAVPADAETPDRYPQHFTGAFMTEGQMYVVAGEDVSPGDAVYWNSTTKRYTKTNTDTAIPGAVFDTSGGNGDIVEISLNHR